MKYIYLSKVYICLFLMRKTMSRDLHFKSFNLAQLALGHEILTKKHDIP
jgi:hypothetical protein